VSEDGAFLCWYRAPPLRGSEIAAARLGCTVCFTRRHPLAFLAKPPANSERQIMLDWPSIIEQAKEIVESYDTSVTLRQLFYQLVGHETESVYQRYEIVAERDLTDGVVRYATGLQGQSTRFAKPSI
jgi:hypothetical protein